MFIVTSCEHLLHLPAPTQIPAAVCLSLYNELQVQLRIPPAQCLGRHLYLRGDGTLAYFYTTEDLSGLAVAAGLEVVECHYVCVINKNRKTGQCLRRSFVHGVFRKPLHGHLLP